MIGESVHTHEQSSETQVEAAINGTLEVYIPVFFGVMTTVAAFIPLIIVPGRMGQFFGWLGITAIICLFFSLIESQLILPAHLAHRRTSSKKGAPNRFVERWVAFQGSMADGLERLGREQYGRALARAIEWRYVTAAIAVGVVVLTVALFASGRMRYQFFPAVEGDTVAAVLTMPQGVPIEQTEEAIAQLQRAVDTLAGELADEYPGQEIILHSVATDRTAARHERTAGYARERGRRASGRLQPRAHARATPRHRSVGDHATLEGTRRPDPRCDRIELLIGSVLRR